MVGSSEKRQFRHPSDESTLIGYASLPVHRITRNTAITMGMLATAGLGISLLSPDLVERELFEGSLHIIPIEPAFEAVRYRAIYVPAPGSLGQIIAEAALQVSSFDKG